MNQLIDIHVSAFHGLCSRGDNLSILQNALEYDAEMMNLRCVVSEYDYPVLSPWQGRNKWARLMVPEFILVSLAHAFERFPAAYHVVLWHSNATFAGEKALTEYFIDRPGLCKKMRIDKLLLFGSVIDRRCRWERFSEIDVVNYVGSKDIVSSMARFYGMGNSGKRGFKHKSRNLKQYYDGVLEQPKNDNKRWKHSDFVEPLNYPVIKQEVFREF